MAFLSFFSEMSIVGHAMPRSSLIVMLALLAGVGLGVSGGEAADTPTHRSTVLCVLDRPAILQRSKLAANEGARFQQVRAQAQAKFDSDSRAIDADARALESFRGSLPAAVLKLRSNDIARRRAEMKTRAEQINHNLAQLDIMLTSNVEKMADPQIRIVEQQRGCSMLISRDVLIHLDDPDLDITSAVISLLNSSNSPEAIAK